jgi:hypothetical protein
MKDICLILYCLDPETSWVISSSSTVHRLDVPSDLLIFQSDADEIVFHRTIPEIPRQVLTITRHQSRDGLLQFVLYSDPLKRSSTSNNRLTIRGKDEIVNLESIEIPLSLHCSGFILSCQLMPHADVSNSRKIQVYSPWKKQGTRNHQVSI